MTVAIVLETLLTNAITVVVLAGIVWVACRFIKKPAIAHCLWVLLLVKLLTPSIVQLPFSLTIENAWFPGATQSELIGQQATEAGDGQFQAGSADSGSQLGAASIDTLTDENAELRIAEANASSAFLVLLGQALLAVWILGSVVCLGMLAWRQYRFSRFLRLNEEIDVDLIGEGYNLAWEMGLENPPRVRILRGALSPMLCGFGRSLTLIIPAELSDRLSRESRATLIVHELAHFMRCDHWVRVVEVAASIVFWWNPMVWFIRRQIEIFEEECCDARVVAHFPTRPRQYAEALLDTIDFLAERQVVLPPVACGLACSASLLRQRLTQIMGEVQQPDSRRQELTTLFVGAALIVPMQAIQFAQPQAFEPDAVLSVVAAESNPGQAIFVADVDESSLRVNDPSGRFAMVQTASDDWVIQDLRTFEFKRLPSQDITCAAFVSNGRLAVGTSTGEVQLINCSQSQIHRRIRFSKAVRSLDWSDACSRLAMVDESGTLHILAVPSGGIEGYRRLDSTLSVNSVRFSRDGEELFVGTGDRDSESPGAVLVVDRKTLLIIEAVETPQAVAVAELAEDSNELNAYEWSGRVDVMTPNPLTSVAARWLPKDAADAISFSSQTDDDRFVPEQF